MQSQRFIKHYSIFLFALLFTVILYCDMQFSYSQQGWMAITLLAMTQFTVGTWVRQTLIRTITIIASLFLVVASHTLFPSHAGLVLFSMTLLACIVSMMLLEIKFSDECMVFALCLLFANLMQVHANFQDPLMDVLLVASLMLVISMLVTLFSIKQAFIQLMLYHIDHLINMIDRVHDHALSRKRFMFVFNDNLQQDTGWIFALGLSPGLRAGFRYYTLQIERAIELLYGIQKIAHEIKQDEEMTQCFDLLMSNNKTLLSLLRAFFKTGSLFSDTEDWLQDIVLFEKLIEQTLPAHAATLHFHARDLTMIELLRYCKDLRQVFLQLLMALPHSLKD